MRKLILTTAAVAAAIGLAGCSKTTPQESVSITYDTLTDTRDGQKYKTMKIGKIWKQTWMAQNINYQTKDGSWCYMNSISYCKKYGRLYDWYTAKTVCPKGWKLPSREDWDYLGHAVGGEKGLHYNGMTLWYDAGQKLKSKSGWNVCDGECRDNGADSYGFSALPGGYQCDGGYFGRVGYCGDWWTATEYDSDNAYIRGMCGNHSGVTEDDDDKSYGFSVRCVADNP
jgi:uncharacterized protein (TIGR02145 family)